MAAQYIDGADPALQAYLQEINRIPLLTPEEEIQVTRDVVDGRDGAREKMIRSNLRLVVSIAKKFVRRGLPLPDLIEEGNLGLMHAVERFDPNVGTRFSTYATYWIKQAVRRALANKAKTIRLPAYMVEIIARWKHTAAQLADELGREPAFEEVAEKLDISRRRLGIIRRALKVASASATNSPDMMWMFGDVLSDTRTPAPDANLFDEADREILKRLLGAIDKREAEILRLRYGLDSGEPMTLQEIGNRMSLARERVRQIENRALQKLKMIAAQEHLD